MGFSTTATLEVKRKEDDKNTYEWDDIDWYTFEIYDEEGNLLTDD